MLHAKITASTTIRSYSKIFLLLHSIYLIAIHALNGMLDYIVFFQNANEAENDGLQEHNIVLQKIKANQVWSTVCFVRGRWFLRAQGIHGNKVLCIQVTRFTSQMFFYFLFKNCLTTIRAH